MLRLENIHKSYGSKDKKTHILNGISLEVSNSEVLAIVGRSGSGKSTILNIIAGIDYPDSGEVMYHNQKLSCQKSDALADFRLRNIGLVFQFFNFLPSLSIAQNISMPGYLLKTPSHTIKERVDECLNALHILPIKNRLPHEVSGGELQRAAIARAIFNKPKLILADEPTGNLDKENADSVYSVFLELIRETKSSLILVTHDAALAKRTDRTLHIDEGEFRE
jgi:ABC-type lipoprotein export system ATPase subunit